MAQPHLTDPPPKEYSLDPAYDDLTPTEQAQSWWRGSDDAEAVRAGDDVEWAHEEYFPSGLGRSRLNDEQWARVAYFIASGVSVMEVAKYFGVSRTTIWRGMQRSSGLRYRILHERKMFQRESDNRFVALRQAVVTGLQQAISAGNVRVLLWAAQRLDLGGTILPEEERLPIRRPTPRPRPQRAPAAVREILAAAREQVTPVIPVPAEEPATGMITVTAPDPLPPIPEDAPIAATATAPPADAPIDTAEATAPLSPITLVPRRAREPVRRLLTKGRKRRPPIPQLVDDVDWLETDAMLANTENRARARPTCTAAEPLDPYRPLRNYRWP
ncbi:helix-turn-helix domain-containing protein [Niveispirillum sp. KHB5.9]|uniref:helix-turn-helix domain-containing protein n=1 Tax=Niveispirillum sp. KHB5.9 TaxID=3400269 RepID=UPI003A8562B3